MAKGGRFEMRLSDELASAIDRVAARWKVSRPGAIERAILEEDKRQQGPGPGRPGDLFISSEELAEIGVQTPEASTGRRRGNARLAGRPLDDNGKIEFTTLDAVAPAPGSNTGKASFELIRPDKPQDGAFKIPDGHAVVNAIGPEGGLPLGTVSSGDLKAVPEPEVPLVLEKAVAIAAKPLVAELLTPPTGSAEATATALEAIEKSTTPVYEYFQMEPPVDDLEGFGVPSPQPQISAELAAQMSSEWMLFNGFAHAHFAAQTPGVAVGDHWEVPICICDEAHEVVTVGLLKVNIFTGAIQSTEPVAEIIERARVKLAEMGLHDPASAIKVVCLHPSKSRRGKLCLECGVKL